MVKISEIAYTRPNKEEILQKFRQFKSAFDGAATADEFFELH